MIRYIYIKVRAKVKATALYLLPFLVLSLLASCSEEDSTVPDFVNWAPTNASYFNDLYAETQQRIANGDDSWRIIRTWTLEEEMAQQPDNYIVAHILEEGSGSPSYHSTDSVVCHYAGRLLPSTWYPEGYVFDKSYFGELDPQVAVPVTFSINGVIDGFATALMEMRPGSHWVIYIPAALGYGATTKTNTTTGDVSIPAYSTLIFDVYLVSHHAAAS